MNDADLLNAYQEDRNQEWIGILLQRYTLLLFGVCMKYLKDETEARDAVQQIFLKVLTEAGKYRIDFFKSWLYMVAKNYCLMRLRNKQTHAIRELSEQMESVPEADSRDHLQNEETYDMLEEAIEELNMEQKQTVILFYLHKNSYSQIAEKTGFTAMQVKSYIQNGKRNLRIILERKASERKIRRT